jgi:nicotinamide-nucleotide amidase
MSAPRVELLAIGDELLLGETVDTNSAWLAQRLAQDGIAVVRKTVAGDDVAAIRDALDAALARARVVICTGGLGPTPDDLTRHAVAALYGRELVIDDGWLEVLRARYDRRGIAMPASNRVQAELPAGALLLPNPLGTAPGIAIADDVRGLTVLLPGVPAEMRALVEAEVLPLLRARLAPPGAIVSRTLRTAGVSEALLADRIADIADAIEREPRYARLRLAFLPQTAGVDLRLTLDAARADATHDDATHDDAALDEALLDDVVALLEQRLGADLYAHGAVDLAAVVGGLLRARGLTVALAESCTGGLVAKRLTDEAGASDYVQAGFVTYANEAKTALLGVGAATLAQHGAVSDECAREMCEGARVAGGADVAIAITGIAGPGGGTPDKPVGTVWIGVATAAGTSTRRHVLPGDRAAIRERAAQAALDMLRRVLLADDGAS